MRIRILSDLHLEYCDWTPPPAPADVVVLAGDIHNGSAGMTWARRHFGSVPVIYVPGNHEFYGGHLSTVLEDLHAEADRRKVHLLDGDTAVLDGVRFLGATLWTDFELFGSEPENIAQAMDYARAKMTDFECIRGARGAFRPEESRDMHLAQADWLRRELRMPFAGTTVVVTHFLPHRICIHPKWARYRSNSYFVSDLDELVRAPVSLWIHGHTHESVDAQVNGTRIVCNPRGLQPTDPNTTFDPRLVIEIRA